MQKLGHDPVVLPLSRIVRVTPNPVPSTLGFHGALITSPNAIEHMPVTLHRRVSELPCHVVGERTDDVARSEGFDVRAVAANSAELAVQLKRTCRRGDSLVYVCGRVRSPSLERRLGGHGVSVFAVEVYDTPRISHATYYVLDLFDGKPFDAVLVYSLVAAKQITELFFQGDIEKYLTISKFYCISNRAADELRHTRKIKIKVANRPSEDAIIELLRH